MEMAEYKTAWMPKDVQEMAMGHFAVGLAGGEVALFAVFCGAMNREIYGLYQTPTKWYDGIAFIISVQDYGCTASEAILPGIVGHGRLLSKKEIAATNAYLTSRFLVVLHLNRANVPQHVLRLRVAAPLCARQPLSSSTVMYRYTPVPVDPCLQSQSSSLRTGTYLTTKKDLGFANCGFGVVGRYSLPCPLPSRYRHEYLVPGRTSIRVGTVEAQFRQAGGGVEIRLDAAPRHHRRIAGATLPY